MMPPQKKSDLEKLAWAWTETVSPEEIGRVNLEISYRIGLKNCKNCKRNCSNNPQCLTGLGEEKYLKSQPAEVASLESSLSELRDPTQYVGLKNLGATCYVNSLIQVWFHNEDIRKIIYKWEISEDPEERESLARSQANSSTYHPVTVVGQLQYIFAMMQFGNKQLLDPTSLAIALSLDVDTQQDAQEFSKLLLAHIENKFQNINLKTQLQRLTQGTYVYVNRCSTCSTEYKTPTTFYELDLQLAPTLKDAIEKYLIEEELVGANKYHCRNCDEKQEAKRFIRLDSLPDTLNFQLLRFVFHRESNQKKKLSSYIQFPEELDMSEYLNSTPGTHLYSLVAVLSHKGPSAHSGHYVVNICNSSGEWYQFSDDKVEIIQNKRIEDGSTDNGKVPKKGKVPKGFMSSNAAYMLVYKRVSQETKSRKLQRNAKKEENHVKSESLGSESSETSKRKETSDSDSSDNIYSPVKRVKNKHIHLRTENTERKLGKKLFDEKKMNTEELNHEDDAMEVSETELKIEEKDSEGETSEECSTMSPKMVTKGKKESSMEVDVPNDAEVKNDVRPKPHYERNYQLLNGDAHRAMSCGEKDHYEALEFKKWEVSETLRELVQQENDSHEIGLLAVQQEKQKKIEEQNIKRQEVIDFFKIINSTIDFENFVWIPTSWITKWLNDHSGNQEGLSGIDSTVMMCSHGKMDPGKVHKAKCVPLSAAELLFRKFEMKVKLDQDSLCESCVKRRCKTLRFKSSLERDHKEVTEIMKSLKEPTEDCYIVGAQSLKYWRRLAMDRLEGENRDENDGDIVSDSKINDNANEGMDEDTEGIRNLNDDLLCVHKGLRTPDASRKIVPEAAWMILKKYFPEAAEYKSGTASCQTCEVTMETAQRARKDDKIKSKQQKDELSELYYNKHRSEILKDKNPEKIYFVVEKGFLDAWRSFIRCNSRAAPNCINNGVLLCEQHKGFLYSPSIANELYTVVTEDEWKKLNEFYPSDHTIKIRNIGIDEAEFETDPVKCGECMQARLDQEWLESLNYENAVIYIQCVDEGEESESAIKSSRSSRTRRKTKGSHELKVSSQITLKELKVMTMNICGAGPFDQHLTLDDHELTDPDQDLGSLGVYPNAVLKLKVDTPPDNDVDLESDSASREASSPEKGFKGTELVPS